MEGGSSGDVVLEIKRIVPKFHVCVRLSVFNFQGQKHHELHRLPLCTLPSRSARVCTP